MKKISLLVSVGLACLFAAPLARADENIHIDAKGVYMGSDPTDRAGVYGNAVVQPASSSQAAITDSTTGTAGTTLAATVGVQTIPIPLTSLVTGIGTGAMDLLTTYTPGFKFKLLAVDWVTTLAGTGSGATQAFNLKIGSTATTGGVCTVTLASTATVGAITAGTAISALNTGSSADTISLVKAGSGTVFTAGAGYFVIRIQNMDTADAFASLARLQTAIRSGVVNFGIIKGAP